LNFLEVESRRNSIKNKVLKKNSTESLISDKNRHQLNVIRKELIKLKYINNIPLDQFVKCLSGKEVFPQERIHWKTSKFRGYYFFSKLCSDFSIKRLNTSVVCIKGKFDSNNKPTIGYEEIDSLLKS